MENLQESLRRGDRNAGIVLWGSIILVGALIIFGMAMSMRERAEYLRQVNGSVEEQRALIADPSTPPFYIQMLAGSESSEIRNLAAEKLGRNVKEGK